MSFPKTTNEPIVSKIVSESVNEWLSDDVNTVDFDSSMTAYHNYVYRKWVFMFVCIFVAVLVIGLALTLGTYKISFLQTYVTIWDHITGHIVNSYDDRVIFDLRLPRIAVGIVAGAGLAVAGAAMQSSMKNPLADPYTTGVSSGAGFGATLAIATGFTVVSGDYGLIANAFIFALIPTAVIMSVGKMKNASPTIMIMAGIAVMYLFNACSTILKLWTNPDDLQSLYYWEVGTLSTAQWQDLYFMLPIVLSGIILIQLLSRQLNVLSTGDENSKALGVNAERLRILCLIVVAFMSASIVCYTGLIGFVGLIAPHVVRIFIGPDNRYLIPASAIFGAMLLLAADLIGRTIIAPVILPVGVITAFLGGPMFLWLMIRKKNRIWG